MSIPAASFAYVFAANAKAARMKAAEQEALRASEERRLYAPSLDEGAWRRDCAEDCRNDRDDDGSRH